MTTARSVNMGRKLEAVDPWSIAAFRQQVARNYLAGLNTTMWGRGFDLSQEESKEAAVEWLANVLGQVRA